MGIRLKNGLHISTKIGNYLDNINKSMERLSVLEGEDGIETNKVDTPVGETIGRISFEDIKVVIIGVVVLVDELVLFAYTCCAISILDID